jgi:archaellum biogenesis protein FlaJ (TadC family)
MEDKTKSILISKTFWVNVLTIVVILLNRNARVIDPLLIEPFAVVTLPLVNVGLRAITEGAVRLKGK